MSLLQGNDQPLVRLFLPLGLCRSIASCPCPPHSLDAYVVTYVGEPTTIDICVRPQPGSRSNGAGRGSSLPNHLLSTAEPNHRREVPCTVEWRSGDGDRPAGGGSGAASASSVILQGVCDARWRGRHVAIPDALLSVHLPPACCCPGTPSSWLTAPAAERSCDDAGDHHQQQQVVQRRRRVCEGGPCVQARRIQQCFERAPQPR